MKSWYPGEFVPLFSPMCPIQSFIFTAKLSPASAAQAEDPMATASPDVSRLSENCDDQY